MLRGLHNVAATHYFITVVIVVNGGSVAKLHCFFFHFVLLKCCFFLSVFNFEKFAIGFMASLHLLYWRLIFLFSSL